MLKAFVKVNVQIQLDDDDETPSELSVEQQVELDAKRAQLKYPISQHFNAVCYPATKEDATSPRCRENHSSGRSHETVSL